MTQPAHQRFAASPQKTCPTQNGPSPAAQTARPHHIVRVTTPHSRKACRPRPPATAPALPPLHVRRISLTCSDLTYSPRAGCPQGPAFPAWPHYSSPKHTSSWLHLSLPTLHRPALIVEHPHRGNLLRQGRSSLSCPLRMVYALSIPCPHHYIRLLQSAETVLSWMNRLDSSPGLQANPVALSHTVADRIEEPRSLSVISGHVHCFSGLPSVPEELLKHTAIGARLVSELFFEILTCPCTVQGRQPSSLHGVVVRS